MRVRGEKIVERQAFHCSKLGGTALVLKEVDLGPYGEGPRRVLGFNCANRDECGIAIGGGGHRANYDWKRCKHPEAPKGTLPASRDGSRG